MKETSIASIARRTPVTFEQLTTDLVTDKLAVGLHGEPGTGKSRFIVTAPGAVGVVPLDRKTRMTLQRARQQVCPDKTILMPKEDFIRHENPMRLAIMSPEDSMVYYRNHVNRIKDAAYTLAEMPGVETIAIDSFSQFCEDCLFANYGRTTKIMPRDRGSFNQEIRDFLNSLQHKHLILTMRSKEIWKNETATGQFKHSGWGDLGYYINVLVELKRSASGEFAMDIKMCQANASLHGNEGKGILIGEDIGFDGLFWSVYEEMIDCS